MVGVLLLAYTINRRWMGKAIYQPLTRSPFAADSTLVDKKKGFGIPLRRVSRLAKRLSFAWL
jgi:hypothetical protein